MRVLSSESIFMGSTRNEVAVGTSTLSSIFSAILEATPLIFCSSAESGIGISLVVTAFSTSAAVAGGRDSAGRVVCPLTCFPESGAGVIPSRSSK